MLGADGWLLCRLRASITRAEMLKEKLAHRFRKRHAEQEMNQKRDKPRDILHHVPGQARYWEPPRVGCVALANRV